MDFEYDVYSTTFDAQGNPQEAAQDNIRIINDTWKDFGGDWFASLQGQLPGVQQQNVMLSGNRINAHSPLVEIVGTNPYLTPNQYWNSNLTIANNRGLQTAVPTTSASIADPPGNVAAMQIQGVANTNISGNVLPLFDGAPDYFANTPYVAVLQAYEDQNITMKGNDFSGAYDILQAGSGGNTVSQCGNTYGVNGVQTDGNC